MIKPVVLTYRSVRIITKYVVFFCMITTDITYNTHYEYIQKKTWPIATAYITYPLNCGPNHFHWKHTIQQSFNGKVERLQQAKTFEFT